MLLPKNGRIVVIDDKPEQALPLLMSLWQNGFASIYFTGEKKYLPSLPLDDARVIFLDMELVPGGYTDSENKTKAAAAAKILKSIIDTNKNTVYLVIMWATHSELESKFWEYIRGVRCEFIPLRLDKVKCMADPTIIPAEIVSALRNNNAFNFFMIWENIIHKSSNDIILDYASFFPVNVEWDNKILGIFKKLAEEYAGKTLNAADHEQIVKNAMCAFNGTFADTLENNIAQVPATGISFDRTIPVSDNGIIAKINAKLMLDQNNAIPKPGSVYANNEEDNVQEYFNSGGGSNGIEKVFCEVSPTCDYSQNKWKLNRILCGVKVPISQKDSIKKADYLYETPVLDIGGQAITFVFDFRKLKSKNLADLQTLAPFCTFRHDLLIVIQHKMASHSSRPGMVSL